MSQNEENSNQIKNIILGKVDEIYLLSGYENYVPKYITNESAEIFIEQKNRVNKIDIVNIREFFRRQLNNQSLIGSLSTQELTDVQNAYEYSRIKVKILFGLPLD
jgi:hypothetical protein